MDLWESIAKEASSSKTATEMFAQSVLTQVALPGMMSFIRAASSDSEASVRAALVTDSDDFYIAVSKVAADQGVDLDSLLEYGRKVLADCGCDKPKTVDIEKDIGGPEGKKYKGSDKKPQISHGGKEDDVKNTDVILPDSESKPKKARVVRIIRAR